MAANPYELGAEGIQALLQWIVGGQANSASQSSLSGGLQNAQNSITGAYDQANAWISPYAQAGMQDFNNYRDQVYSGAFEQPYGETYQPLNFQNQGFSAGQFNPQTQSYGGGFQPFQAPAQGPISQPRLPSMGNMSHDPVAPQQTPQRGQAQGGMTADQLVEMIHKLAQGSFKQEMPAQGVYNQGQQQMQNQMPGTLANNPYQGATAWAVNRQFNPRQYAPGGRSGPYG